MDELFDVVDERDQPVGRLRRSEVHARGLLHRAVHVFIVDGSGRVLLQKRSAGKDTFPGRWTTSVSGHVDAGESYEEAARREVQEEAGLLLPAAGQLREIGRAPACEETDQEFVAVYALVHDGPFCAPPDEVAELRWTGRAELEAWIGRAPAEFTPSFLLVWRLFGGGAARAAGRPA